MSSLQSGHTGPVLSTARIETLTDGVFAIVMTLLILDIKVPHFAEGLPKGAVEQNLLANLYAQRFNLLAYALSFVILGVLWVGHHNQFYFIKRADRTLLWINILFLMCVAFIPFSAGLLAAYNDIQTAVVLYGANLIVAGVVLYFHWWYGTRDHRLVEVEIEPQVMRNVTRRILTPPVAYLLAIAFSFISPLLSIALYVLVPVAYILPARIDRVWIRRHIHPHGEAEVEAPRR